MIADKTWLLLFCLSLHACESNDALLGILGSSDRDTFQKQSIAGLKSSEKPLQTRSSRMRSKSDYGSVGRYWYRRL